MFGKVLLTVICLKPTWLPVVVPLAALTIMAAVAKKKQLFNFRPTLPHILCAQKPSRLFYNFSQNEHLRLYWTSFFPL